MRKILVPFAMLGLTSLPLAACDVEGETNDATNNTTTDTIQETTPPPAEFYTIVVDDTDRFDGRCATSTSGAHGADINAVELAKADGTVLGYFDAVVYKPGTKCTIGNDHDNPEEVKGAPTGASLTDGFVSLGGGLVAGEIGANAIQILEGYTITVYEIDDDFCGGISACVGSEGFDVSVTNQNSCIDSPADCDFVQVTGTDGAEGTTEMTVPELPAF